MSIWKTWTELKIILKIKKIYLFGRSEDWVPETLRKIDQKKEISSWITMSYIKILSLII